MRPCECDPKFEKHNVKCDIESEHDMHMRTAQALLVEFETSSICMFAIQDTLAQVASLCGR